MITEAMMKPIFSGKQRGSSLLEVLIAIVIMSFGLLAMGGLAASSIQYGKMAQFQTVGVQLSVDLADRIRANSSAALVGVCTGKNSCYDKTSVYSSTTAVLTPVACAIATACTPSEIAARDIVEWRNALRNGLPGGDAYVQRVVNKPTIDIWIMWIDPNLQVGSDSSLITSGSSSCPAAAVPANTTVPHCLYFRAAI
jgi:type IV pilus assembly protein PilV